MLATSLHGWIHGGSRKAMHHPCSGQLSFAQLKAAQFKPALNRFEAEVLVDAAGDFSGGVADENYLGIGVFGDVVYGAED